MSKAKWKGPYINSKYYKKKHNILIMSRASEISPQFVGLIINVHNGKAYTELTIVTDMIGHKFGEFIFTRVKFSFKKKLKK
jgi:small subunit ribosomal protein S19